MVKNGKRKTVLDPKVTTVWDTYPASGVACMRKWTLHKVQQNNVLVFVRKVLRTIFGPCIDRKTGEWRIGHGVEIGELYRKPNLVSSIEERGGYFGLATRGGKESVLIDRVQCGPPESQ